MNRSETMYRPDFIERNGAWLLTVIGMAITCFMSTLVYFLKSRCSLIRCCGCECQRSVVDLENTHNDSFNLDSRSPPRENAPRAPSPSAFMNRIASNYFFYYYKVLLFFYQSTTLVVQLDRQWHAKHISEVLTQRKLSHGRDAAALYARRVLGEPAQAEDVVEGERRAVVLGPLHQPADERAPRLHLARRSCACCEVLPGDRAHRVSAELRGEHLDRQGA
ncbi:MAG: hypothetical protein SGPRY_007774, partial [Prymnesium sp.]